MRFVAPRTSDRYYELRVFESGAVETRPDNEHDLFNALAWLAFPRTKARINAMHASALPGEEKGRRTPLRDLLTLFDEGGAIVCCEDAELAAHVRQFRWKTLFWDCRERVLSTMRIQVLGHAVLEKALVPWPGIACKALFVRAGDPDALAEQWLSGLAASATPRLLLPLPVFGYPGWLAQSESASFYDDERYFRPFRREAPRVPTHPPG